MPRSAEITRLCLLLAVGWLAACASPMPAPSWLVADRAGTGVDLHDAPDGSLIETLRAPGGPGVTPIGIRGNHWQVRTASGRVGWLDSAEFPVPALSSPFVAEHQIHVATAFPFADEASEPLLAIQVDTLLPREELDSPALIREVESIWALYRPFTGGVQRVSIMLLSSDSDLAAPFHSSQGDVLGYRRLVRRLCAHRVDLEVWSPLHRCRSDRWLERPGGTASQPRWDARRQELQ